MNCKAFLTQEQYKLQITNTDSSVPGRQVLLTLGWYYLYLHSYLRRLVTSVTILSQLYSLGEGLIKVLHSLGEG